jgi:hypothetical protein
MKKLKQMDSMFSCWRIILTIFVKKVFPVVFFLESSAASKKYKG